jgi:4-hydroxybenzoate polyprenyltransferase
MSPRNLWRQFKIIAEMIKIEHTLFALPFAFMGAFLAARGLPKAGTCGWILVAMVGARSAAMAFNRLVDSEIDARNPRTLNRALPRGLLKKGEVILFIWVAAGLFLWAAAMLNLLSFILAWPVLGVLFLYSYTKRFTWGSHFILGFCLGMTPLAGWIAVIGTFDLLPVLLSLGVLCWTAGFDLIYACQDYEVDRKQDLYSIPARFGIRGALILSALLHVFTALSFCTVGWLGGLAWPFWAALVLTLICLAYEHAIVKPSDLSRVNLAFFTANGIVSMAMAAGTYLALVI